MSRGTLLSLCLLVALPGSVPALEVADSGYEFIVEQTRLKSFCCECRLDKCSAWEFMRSASALGQGLRWGLDLHLTWATASVHDRTSQHRSGAGLLFRNAWKSEPCRSNE